MARPKALLFDWDNTLVDTWPCIERATNITLTTMGQAPWTTAEVRARVAGSLRDTFPKIYGNRWEQAREVYYRAFEQVHLEMLTEVAGAAAFLQAAAKSGVYMGVVSNKTGKYLRQEAAHLGWDKHFKRLVGAQDAVRDKPEIDPVLMALDASGLTPSTDVWLIGDAAIDVVCANNAGMTSVLVHAPSNNTDPAAALHAADFAALAKLLDL